MFRDQPLERIYEDPIRFPCLIHNHMVKMLSITPEEMTDGMLTVVDFEPSHLERAKRNLAERIGVWGVQEHFDDFCDELDAPVRLEPGGGRGSRTARHRSRRPMASGSASPATRGRSTSSSTSTLALRAVSPLPGPHTGPWV